MTYSNKILLAVALTFGVSLMAFAQGGPPSTPVDGGLSLLLAAGGIYGLKKLKDSRK